MSPVRLRRGKAKRSDLVGALDQLGVKVGEDFVIVPVEEWDRPMVPPGMDAVGPSNGTETSREAAYANAPRSGSQRAAVLRHVGRMAGGAAGGATRDECSVALELPAQSSSARMWELAQGGYIEAAGLTRATQNGQQAEVVRPTPKGWDWLALHEGIHDPTTTEVWDYT